MEQSPRGVLLGGMSAQQLLKVITCLLVLLFSV